ncbi:V-type ATPase subunit [Candidatus Margulisiibacteriota bacterium]
MPTDKYTIGRIRSIESRMLDENKLLRMADAESFQQAFNILNETDYAPLLSKLNKPFDYELMLEIALKELKYLSQTLAPNNKIIDVIWEKYDYENIKLLIKAKKKNIENPPLLPYGNIDPSLLKEHIMKENGWLPKRLTNTIASAQHINDFLKMFDYVDQQYLIYLKEVAATENAPYLLSKSLLGKAKYKTDGNEPLVAFLFQKEAEIHKIGLILECKENFVPSEQIKQRVKK